MREWFEHHISKSLDEQMVKVFLVLSNIFYSNLNFLLPIPQDELNYKFKLSNFGETYKWDYRIWCTFAKFLGQLSPSSIQYPHLFTQSAYFSES